MFPQGYQISATLREMPRVLRTGAVPRDLTEYIAKDGSPRDEFEIRVRLLEEGLVRWFQSDPEQFMRSFMDAFGFDWADVRELKTVTFSEESEGYRCVLVYRCQVATEERLPDLMSAMRLVEYWLRLAAERRPDGYIEDFNFASGVIVQNAPQPSAGVCLIGQFLQAKRNKFTIARALSVSALLLVLLFSTQLRPIGFLHIFTGFMAFADIVCAVILALYNWTLPFRVECMLGLETGIDVDFDR